MSPFGEIDSSPAHRTTGVTTRIRDHRQREAWDRRTGSPTSVGKSPPLTWALQLEVFIEGGVIRRLWDVDTDAYRDHLFRLDPESRYNRFCAAISDDMIQIYAATAHSSSVILHSFFVDGVLRGAVDLRIHEAAYRREAEAAFSIEQPWQSLGIGSALLKRSLLVARNRGVEFLHVCCLFENQRMQRLARKFEAELTFDCGSVIGKLESPQPTPLSVMHELLVDGQSFAAAYADFQSRLLTTRRAF